MRLRMMAEYEAGVAAVAATDSPTAKGSLWVETARATRVFLALEARIKIAIAAHRCGSGQG